MLLCEFLVQGPHKEIGGLGQNLGPLVPYEARGVRGPLVTGGQGQTVLVAPPSWWPCYSIILFINDKLLYINNIFRNKTLFVVN
jgi:hypothetical protein